MIYKILNHINSFSTIYSRCTCILILFFFIISIHAQETTSDSDNKIRTVVIDPGHGGKDSGACGKKGMEKDIVLAIGLKLGKYIEENIPDLKVIYTRKTDEFIPLYKRAEIANENNADLFISIHANGWSNPKSFGTETLVLGLHRSNENFEVAKRENSVILLEDDYTTRYENFDPNSLESYIVFSLMQNVYDHQSISFAGLVQEQFRDRAHRKDRGVKRQGLLVLAQTSMPGVLVETGFVTNEDEERYLLSEEGQDYISSAIYRAFKDYKSEIESKSVINSKLEAVNSESESIEKTVEVKIVAENEIPDQALEKPFVLSANPVYYKVQIFSSSISLSLESSEFIDFTDVEEFKTESNYKYAVGYKDSYDDVVIYSKWVKNRYPDAFIIAVQDGLIIPVRNARQFQGIK